MRRLKASINTATVFAVSISVLCSVTCQYPSTSHSSQDLLGLECSPPFGFLRNVCGPEVILEEEVVPAPVYLYGPNTCRITQTVQRNELEYTYQNYCDWFFSHAYYNYIWQCQVICQPTTTCTEQTQEFERSAFECCPGFQVRPADDPSHYEYLFRLYYTRIPAVPVGCPVAVGDTILDCLVILELTEFISYVNQSDLFPLFNESSDNVFTVFAPSNAAFDAQQEELTRLDIDPNMLVGHHVVEGTVKESDLVFDQRFMTLSNTTIHSTAVVFADRSLYQYNPQYSRNNHPSALIRYTNIEFIGGGRVVNADACRTDGGETLQVIDRVLIPASETIASILVSNSNFSLFVEALRFAKVLDFLDKEDVSRTVFAPTDDAFDSQIPPDLFICLMYNRLPLHDLVLFHIARGADYTPSLTLRQFTHTLQQQPIHVSTDSQGNITFLTDPRSPIVSPNIPASNGVVHIVENVLIPPNMDYGECADLVPTTPPPTTPPATTMVTTPMLDDTTTMPDDTTLPVTTMAATTMAATTMAATTMVATTLPVGGPAELQEPASETVSVITVENTVDYDANP